MAALILVLAGCGGQSQLENPGQSATATAAPSLELTAVPATPIIRQPSIGEIVWTSVVEPDTNAPVEAIDDFSADAEGIIAAARGNFLPDGAKVDATWSYNNTPLETFSTHLVVDGAQDARWLSFRLERDPDVLWPTGRYEVTISLDNEEAQRASVEVVAPS